jgi:type III pantothenate kinase
MVEGLVQRIRSELDGGASAVVLATGGLADVIAPECPAIEHVEPNLTLDGLRLIWLRNQ